MTVLVTGGAGYIGSHTVVELLGAGTPVVVVDNLVNSSIEAVRRVGRITGADIPFHDVDLRDREGLTRVFGDHPDIDSVIHFAGLKAVGESVADPLRYYDDNVGSSVVLGQVMAAAGVRRLVFSSSATVYGDPGAQEFVETMPLAPVNPYGGTKAVIERVFTDLVGTGDGWRVSLLRYFNPVGAHPSGLIGEDPTGVPNNLFPFVAQVAVGRREAVVVHGDSFPTPDGTGVRDYIHVMDLAAGHVAALAHLDTPDRVDAYNLGSGHGSSVLQVIAAFERASGRTVAHRVGPPRAGDLAAYWANPTKATEQLGWRTTRSLDQACADTWRWQTQNPDGYRG